MFFHLTIIKFTIRALFPDQWSLIKGVLETLIDTSMEVLSFFPSFLFSWKKVPRRESVSSEAMNWIESIKSTHFPDPHPKDRFESRSDLIFYSPKNSGSWFLLTLFFILIVPLVKHHVPDQFRFFEPDLSISMSQFWGKRAWSNLTMDAGQSPYMYRYHREGMGLHVDQ